MIDTNVDRCSTASHTPATDRSTILKPPPLRRTRHLNTRLGRPSLKVTLVVTTSSLPKVWLPATWTVSTAARVMRDRNTLVTNFSTRLKYSERLDDGSCLAYLPSAKVPMDAMSALLVNTERNFLIC